jgi:hypothetical protein
MKILVRNNANWRIPVSHNYSPGDRTRAPHDGKQPGDPLDQWDYVNAVRLQALHRAPPQQPTMWLWSWKENLQRAWNRDRRAVWDQVGLSHCRYDCLVTVRDEARLRRGNDQSYQGHQCSKTMLTGESRFHIQWERKVYSTQKVYAAALLALIWDP